MIIKVFSSLSKLMVVALCVFPAHDAMSVSPLVFPEIPEPLQRDSRPLEGADEFEEEVVEIDITPGPFLANWESIESNYPGSPDWLRDAKFGIWVHFGPQAAGESGDWYARNMYVQGHPAYNNHLKRYGHPSEFGYKDVLNIWNPDKLDPAYLTDLYKRAGARFLMIQGVHHDNYDLWNSQYHPWNSVNIGPKRDLLKEWSVACRENDMRYGVTFHHEYTWWWWQPAFGSDREGEKAGIPYDTSLTLEDGKGKWWEGYDPRLLYGIDLHEYETIEWITPKPGIFNRHLDYARWYAKQWALRMMDVVHNYDPDFIYTDGTVEGPFTGNGTGTGYKCNAMQTVMADYYNNTLKNRGKVDTFSIIKFRHPTNGAVNTAEFAFPDSINSSQPWIREAPVGDWFYAPGFVYDSGMMIRFIIESVSRDGNAALNICLRPDGSIDPECVTMLEEVGRWMDVNGDAIYGSRAWKVLGEGHKDNEGGLRKLPGSALRREHADFKFEKEDFRFTIGKDDNLYAFCMVKPEEGECLLVKSLAKGNGISPDTIKNVQLLGYDGNLEWRHGGEGLEIIFPGLPEASSAAVTFRIE
ncbi:MAG: alpha-L-fucosidase [Muribaculaceae bacterium]|nr:alpha-L-fucosidase [Muribaculaceae bacterium]